MAQLPSVEETTRLILDAMGATRARPDESVRLLPIQLELNAQGYRADDLNAALQHMVEQGWIEGARDGFIRLTEAGYAQI